MNATDPNFGFALPPFNAADALVSLKRQLRDLKLAERGAAFELRGKRVVELALEDHSIQLKLARRPMLTPESDVRVLTSAAEVRKALDEIKKRLARWEQEE